MKDANRPGKDPPMKEPPMKDPPMKDVRRKSLELLVIEGNPQTRITYQVAQQLENHLPIESLAKLAERLPDLTVDKHKLPLKALGGHIGEALFPIDSIEDLVQKLSGGIRQAIGLGASGSIQVRNPALAEILTIAVHGDPENRPGIPVGYISGASRPAGRSSSEKGGA